ncbi:GH92 family glycosyl hydrolase [Variovorax guangxiensis]|uniref:Putative alpha-1,2-mannosidase n=1 Tax=Variovorax guangxiensis TaxID=1775474 RepID=A0A840FPZ0_9BURK|nr:GH92 family glycosyl hydrolase [Variovorax guangxiensis]MBB4222952.1 putative alpha-1,2-mannosidase [Variovorax guangxiensis]
MSTRRLRQLALAMGLASLAACGGGGGGSNGSFLPLPGTGAGTAPSSTTGGTAGDASGGSAGTTATTTTASTTGSDGSNPSGPAAFARQPLANYVNIMRGANSSGDFTRGNTFPAIAVPFGFNFWTPINRNDNNWFYQFHTSTGETSDGALIKTIHAFATVHEPSPWIGNRQSLAIMPIGDLGRLNPENRGQTYSRAKEVAHAHYYSVIFDNGIRTEITPTDHAAYFRFTAPAAMPTSTVLFDRFAGEGSGNLSVDTAANAVSGTVDNNGDKNAPLMYFYAKFDAPITASKNIDTDSIKTWVQFATPDSAKVVGMKIATSFISVDQAKDNLAQEIGDRSFDDVRQLAAAAWDDKLNTVQVEGGTEDAKAFEQKKITLYSNMYRTFLYPNSAWENVRDAATGKGSPTYMSPYLPGTPKRQGKIWVNNGFWDTYRTTWPLYTLLVPTQAGEMLDGFVNAYKDGGWVPRWSGPDYRDSMVATSSDVIFADAYLKGVRNFDADAAYASMLRNASVNSTDGAKGRKGMNKSVFYGYVPSDTMSRESVAWSLEADLNDFGIAQMAKALNKPDDQAYYMDRALHYTRLFSDQGTGTWAGKWFREKDSSGKWTDDENAPDDWGYGYTEGNAWSYQFLAPQDGQGLANLHGGRPQLKASLDTFFSAPTYLQAGSYWTVIHEIKEAHVVSQLAGVGQYQHSNQPVHHSIYMYNYAGAPSQGQKYLRDVMSKLYTSGFDANGLSDGSGYIGDEDNGEQSAWYVFSAMGFYPVSMGRPEYAIGAPYFPKMVVSLENGKRIVITAPGVSDTNRYVQSLRLNGQTITRSYLLHKEIADGATLEFVMGAQPSSWGTGENDVPGSITQGNAKPSPLKSLLPTGTYTVSSSANGQLANVYDRNSDTAWQSTSANAWIEADAAAGQPACVPKIYTLTSGTQDAGQDPRSWKLKASKDGVTWVTLDERSNESFTWRQQTRPFALKAGTESYSKYRIEFANTGTMTVAELELLVQ